MKRRRVIAMLIAYVGVAVIVAVGWPRPQEPEYEGKKLSAWLIELRTTDYSNHMEAEKAVRQIGTNALPWLLKWLRYEEPGWKRMLWSWSMKGPKRLVPLERRLWPWRPSQANYLALQGFEQLREDGSGAVPELKRMVHDVKMKQARWNALLCLAMIGEPIEPLLGDADPWVRTAATNVIGTMHRL